MKNILIVVIIAILASAGQILLKIGVTKHAAELHSQANALSKLISVFINPYVLSGLIIYASCAVAWLWVISRMKLSHAYPLLSLTFVFVPLFANLILGDSIQAKYWLSVGLIISGIVVLYI